MKPYLAEKAGEYVLSMPAGDLEGIAASRSLEADGYFWEGVVRQLVAAHRPDLVTEFTYDSDEESFAAESRNHEALMVVEELLLRAIEDPQELRRLLSRSVDAEFMD